jgi:hypothetical protein
MGPLNKFAMFQDGDLITDVFHDGEIVSDKKIGQAKFFLEIHQKIHDLSLDGNVQGTDGFVADDELRFDSESASNPDSLALTSAELMWKSACKGRIKSHELKKLGHAIHPIRGTHLWKVNFKGFS